MEKKLDAEYLRQKQLIAEGKPTPLPREVNKEQLNTLYHQLYEEYWNVYGMTWRRDLDEGEDCHSECMESAFGNHGQG